jgi:hypothetical protein
MKRYASVGAVVLICLLTTSALCQEPIVYPSKGQNQERIEKDKFQCYSWAKEQTGFDPMQAPAQTAKAEESRSSAVPGAVRGAAGGAAVGAVGGAIAGDTGKGAAIGAATGGVIGGVKSRRERQQVAQEQQTQTQTYNQSRNTYNRAFSACMKGRGYSVD